MTNSESNGNQNPGDGTLREKMKELLGIRKGEKPNRGAVGIFTEKAGAV
jgi:hypothetical protein